MISRHVSTLHMHRLARGARGSRAGVRSLLATILVVLLVPALAVAGALTITDVLQLKEAGFSDEIIIKKVRSDGVAFELTTEAMIRLKSAGVSEAVISVLLDLGSEAKIHAEDSGESEGTIRPHSRVVPMWLEGPPGSSAGQTGRFEIQGHRGARDLAPENSIAGFEKAIALGVDTLEMDAQSTSDRVLVVHHDQKIDGTKCRRTDARTSASKLLKDLTLEEVKAIRCEGGVAIPTLREVLALAHAAPYPVHANVEIKMQNRSRGIPTEEFVALLVDVIDATGMRRRVLVQSFDAEALHSMRRIAPDIPRAVIGRDRGSYLTMVEDTGASALLPRRDRLHREDVEALHARGVAVIPWAVDDPDEMRKLRSWGVDGIITNRPDVALEFRDGPSPPSGELPAQITTESTPRPYDISQVRRVAVYYLTSGDNVDTFLTSLFIERFHDRQGPHELIDPYQLALQPMDGEPFHPAGMLGTLFEEAARHSAQAIIVGAGRWYDTGFRLEVRLIEIRDGRVLWQATAASGLSFSGPSAKREVVRKALRSYPGMR